MRDDEIDEDAILAEFEHIIEMEEAEHQHVVPLEEIIP